LLVADASPSLDISDGMLLMANYRNSHPKRFFIDDFFSHRCQQRTNLQCWADQTKDHAVSAKESCVIGRFVDLGVLDVCFGYTHTLSPQGSYLELAEPMFIEIEMQWCQAKARRGERIIVVFLLIRFSSVPFRFSRA
jgi:hypothetical protein